MRTRMKSLVATLLIPYLLVACLSTHGVAHANSYAPVASVADKPKDALVSSQRSWWDPQHNPLPYVVLIVLFNAVEIASLPVMLPLRLLQRPDQPQKIDRR